jgi:mannose-1-phosphate guanylyltransferase
MLKAVIMAGGLGARLWPISSAGHPKQFLALNGDGHYAPSNNQTAGRSWC